jgi:inosine/xanthosine triphosphate pyrophosphatase family protein
MSFSHAGDVLHAAFTDLDEGQASAEQPTKGKQATSHRKKAAQSTLLDPWCGHFAMLQSSLVLCN